MVIRVVTVWNMKFGSLTFDMASKKLWRERGREFTFYRKLMDI